MAPCARSTRGCDARAGNNGSNNDVTPFYPANYNLDNVVSVAATDHNDQLAGFSNYGATQVDRWQVVGGSDPNDLKPVGSPVDDNDFETKIELDTAEPYVAVRALDSHGTTLGTSRAVTPSG